MRDAARMRFLSDLSPGQMVGRVCFAGLVLLAVVIDSMCLLAALPWLHKPFAGFLVTERMVVADWGSYTWTGVQAGLRHPDKILRINGQAITSRSELADEIKKQPVGTSFVYLVRQGERTFEVAVPSMSFTVVDLVTTFGIPYLLGLFYLFIAVLAFVMKPDTKMSWAFFLACTFVSMVSTVTLSLYIGERNLIRMYLLASAFFPAAAIHLSLCFPEKREFTEKHPLVQLPPYLLAAVLAGYMLWHYPEPSFLHFFKLARIYAVICVAALVVATLHDYFRGVSLIARQRARIVLWGAAMAFPIPALGGCVSTFGCSWLSVPIQINFLLVPIVFFPASVGYAIARHNLFDVDLYIKRAVGYALMTAVIGLAYYSFEMTAKSIFFHSLFGDHAEKLYPYLLPLMIVFFFHPIHHRIQKVVDRIFYRLEYDYHEMVQRIGESMRSLMGLDEIIQTMMQTALGAMFIDSSCVILLNRADNTFVCHGKMGKMEINHDVANHGAAQSMIAIHPTSSSNTTSEAMPPESCLSASSPIIDELARVKKELTVYDVEEDPNFEDRREQLQTVFRQLEAVLILPLITKDRLLGLMSFGNKKSGRFYQREDIDLLRTLTNQGAVAIENAQLMDEVIEKERMEEELNIARDLQMSMLPAVCPQIEGFQIAASSAPAREVGGDFFDFIEMGEQRLGFLIGDVTGKSVSGALVMAASRSVFRMLSEQEASVGEIMRQANRRIKKDIKSGMFVALLYAVIESGGLELGISSAGQTLPVHFEATTGEARLLQVEGDTFPLGILDEADYEETRVNLHSGDRVVFYTDGIVEAMNAEQQIFGFDRLIHVIEQSHFMQAESLLQEIMKQVTAFVGGAPQHDDLTTIVLAVE